jgi:MSHA biogenesis protein MshJ
MKEKFNTVMQKYDALSMRERIIVAAGFLILIILLWYNLVADPIMRENATAQQEIEKLQHSMQGLKQQHARLLQEKQQDPQRLVRQRIAQLQKELSKVDQELRQKLHGLVAPKQMAQLLESVLQKQSRLKLIRVQSLPAQALLQDAEFEDEKQQTEQQTVQLYRHGLQIEFEGSYMATLEYLKLLEDLPWEFYWDHVELKVEDYPKSRVIITVYTLSLREGWIGV